MPGRHRIVCLLAAGLLAFPAAAGAQSAGDDQYEDPFAPEPGQTDDGGSGAGSGTADDESSGGGTVQPAPTPEPAPAAPAAATTAQAQQLPRTGGDAGLLALTGSLLLAGGVAIRVRLSGPARPRS
jgi:hypothetical protein